jgi:hypothetical protein
MILGQFNFQDASGQFQTATLDDDLTWRATDAALDRFLNTRFAATETDWGPAEGELGSGLLARAAEHFGAEPQHLVTTAEPAANSEITE